MNGEGLPFSSPIPSPPPTLGQPPHLDPFEREDRREMATTPFPADIEYSILLRLPVNSLNRFHLVCKSWFSLISSPLFQKDHFAFVQHKPPLLLTVQLEGGYLVAGDNLTLRLSTHNYNNREGSFTPVNNFSLTVAKPCYKPYMHSCLGLVLLFARHRSQPMHICNPSANNLISLPLPTQGPTVSVGFGFAASTQEFKVVRLFLGDHKCRTEVFTLGTTHWRQVIGPVSFPDFGNAPFLHGALHFQPILPYPDVSDTNRITVFDIDTEAYREGIPLPGHVHYYSLGNREGPGFPSSGEFLHLSKFGASLCLTFDYTQLRGYLELWILKDYNNAKWVKGYTIDVSTIFPYPSDSLRAYSADTTGDDIILNCSDNKGVKILGYNIRDGSLSLKKEEEWAATFYKEIMYPLRR